jgi:hypothetical protein
LSAQLMVLNILRRNAVVLPLVGNNNDILYSLIVIFYTY